MSGRQQILALLRLVVQELESLCDEELAQILAGTSSRSILPKPRPRKKRETKQLSPVDVENLVRELANTDSRDQARRILIRDEAVSTRANLERIARELRVHVNKHDKRDAVLDKIVEAVIGVRLRSEAIRDLNLKGTGAGHDQGSL